MASGGGGCASRDRRGRARTCCVVGTVDLPTSDRLRGGRQVVELDELITSAVWPANPEFANYDRGGDRRGALTQRHQRDDHRRENNEGHETASEHPHPHSAKCA